VSVPSQVLNFNPLLVQMSVSYYCCWLYDQSLLLRLFLFKKKIYIFRYIWISIEQGYSDILINVHVSTFKKKKNSIYFVIKSEKRHTENIFFLFIYVSTFYFYQFWFIKTTMYRKTSGIKVLYKSYWSTVTFHNYTNLSLIKVCLILVINLF